MSSYLQKLVKSELMHDFLKDKQAWEHAIALYQGPDPLDHWYNYVCWYENYGHGDPENKFNETLERCLSIFEHNDYYKQDMRMLRLWLKYIEMQPNALHFYQALYQRGVARQNALFYISWGAVLESLQAFKEAESVYNLGFQEKAQPYAELQHALVKIMYARAALQQQQQQQAQQQQQQKVVEEQQVSYQNNSNIHATHAQQSEQQAYHRAQLAYVQQQQQLQQQQQQQTQQQARSLNDEREQQYVNNVHPQQQEQHGYQTVYMPQHMLQQQHHQQVQQQEQHYHAPHSHNISNTHQNLHVHQNTDNHYHQNQPQTHQAHYHINEEAQEQQQQQCLENTPINSGVIKDITEHQQQSYNQEMTHEQLTHENEEEQQKILQEQEVKSPANNLNIEIQGVQYPKRFVNCASNNHELWKPALCLEEAPDENRKCHYAKNRVYPQGSGYEISPEELHAKKYIKTADIVAENPNVIAKHEEKLGIHNRQSADYDSGSSSDKEDIYGFSEREDETLEESADENFDDDDYAPEQNAADNDLEQSDTDDDDEDDDDDEEEDEDDDDDDEDVENEVQSNKKLVQNQYQHKLKKIKENEEQIESSTISLGQNKSIKIKFKKETSSADCNGSNGSNYSAYKIESIYQQEIASPKTTPTTTITNCNFERRNGHNFHPYMLGQTSTPKTNNSFKRHKAKLKRVKQENELSQNYCINSNSSTAERDTTNAAGETALPNANLPNVNDNAVQSANFNDNANYSFSSAVTLDNSNCSISSAVGRLNFKDNSALGLGGATTQLNVTNQSTLTASRAGVSALEISTFQENSYFATQYDANAKERRLAKALETIERHLAKEVIDPFNSELCRAFLTKLDFPQNAEEENYKIIQTPLPKIANTKALNLTDGVNFHIDKEVGRGSYGSVYKATNANTGAIVALKYQKPPNTWEIYICDQVLKRITSPSVLPGLMDISTAIIAPNASLIATEFTPFGSLLDINNKIRQNTTKVMHESLVMHFSAQICNIVDHLHKQKIVHADIKPDNFLLMRVPSTDLHYPSLRLIDFGCAIDMTLFPDPDNTKFRKIIQTDGFTCIEMQEGRPWSYETDLFCVAGTIHVMLFGEYMQPQKRAGSWDIKQKLPRYLKKHVWTHFFSDMLNINPAKLPSLHEMCQLFEEESSRMDSELQKQIRTLSNILYRR